METFMIETPVCVDDVILYPVVCNRMYSSQNAITHWLVANKEPQAIIVCSLNGIDAFDMSSNKVSITSLAEKVPGLKTLLSSHGYDFSSD